MKKFLSLFAFIFISLSAFPQAATNDEYNVSLDLNSLGDSEAIYSRIKSWYNQKCSADEMMYINASFSVNTSDNLISKNIIIDEAKNGEYIFVAYAFNEINSYTATDYILYFTVTEGKVNVSIRNIHAEILIPIHSVIRPYERILPIEEQKLLAKERRIGKNLRNQSIEDIEKHFNTMIATIGDDIKHQDELVGQIW